MDAERIDHVRGTLLGLVDKECDLLLKEQGAICNTRFWPLYFEQLRLYFTDLAKLGDIKLFEVVAKARIPVGVQPKRMETVTGASQADAWQHCAWLLEEALKFREEKREKALRWAYWVIGYTDYNIASKIAATEPLKTAEQRLEALSVCHLYLTASRFIGDPVIRSNINCYVEGVLAFFDLMTIEEAKRLHMPEGENFDAQRK